MSKSVSEAQEQVNAAAKSKELSENIMYFKQWYPFNKFINEPEVERICKKYGLLFGEASKYIGDIPEKNLSEIESFKLRQEDMAVRYSTTYEDRMFQQGLAQSMNRLMPYNPFDNFIGGVASIGNHVRYDRPQYNGLAQANTGEREKFYEKPEFRICAPVKDFEIRYMRVEDGYKLYNIPDPIVLQPVKGGYLIVSKWGVEGEDIDLTNENMN
jgi:hypothetical protein